MDGGQPGQFPVYAAFIIRPEDKSAHDAFREFRSSFQKAGAKFEHLVIFGQHGVSRTALELLHLLGRPRESLPLLVLFSGPAANGVCWARLERGGATKAPYGTSEESHSGSDDIWRMLLARIEAVACGAASDLQLDSVVGLGNISLDNGIMKEIVAEALRRASPGLT